MKITKSTEIKVWITPNELRTIADKLDQKMKIVKLGENVPNHKFIESEITVELIVDQEQWNEDQKQS